MKFIHKEHIKPEYIKPEVGDTRRVTKFLFIPKRIGNETRWLERATFTQQFKFNRHWADVELVSVTKM